MLCMYLCMYIRTRSNLAHLCHSNQLRMWRTPIIFRNILAHIATVNNENNSNTECCIKSSQQMVFVS